MALVFQRSDGGGRLELWKIDGTAAGTMLVQYRVPGSASSYPDQLTELQWQGCLFTHQSLWISDCTSSGTVLRQPSIRVHVLFERLPAERHFHALGRDDRTDLWITDGTPGGTQNCEGYFPGRGSSIPRHLVNVGAPCSLAPTTARARSFGKRRHRGGHGPLRAFTSVSYALTSRKFTFQGIDGAHGCGGATGRRRTVLFKA